MSLAEAFSVIVDPRVVGRSTHDLVEMLVVAVCAMLCGADNFVEIELWAEARLEWLRRFMKLEHGIASHDTLGRVLGLLDAQAVERSFRQWVAGLIPALEAGTVVAVDGKTSRRSGGEGGAADLVSALATGIGVVLGQEATSEKSNELTAIPPLLQTLAIRGAIVTIDAMGTHASIAKVIQEQGADYVLAVKDNQPYLAESMREFFATGQANDWARVAYDYYETAEKDMGASRCAATTPSGNWRAWPTRSSGPDSRCSGWCAPSARSRARPARRSGSTSAASPCRPSALHTRCVPTGR